MTKTTLSLPLLVALSLAALNSVATAQTTTTLVAPYGNVVGTTIAFSWRAVPQAAGYLLNVRGELTAYGNSMEVWYTPEQAGCGPNKVVPPNPGTCTVTLSPPVVAGTYFWSVKTWGPNGQLPGQNLFFFVIKDPAQNWGGTITLEGERFTTALGKAGVGVAWTDHETGLVWALPELGTFTVNEAMFVCQAKTVAHRRGFRLPTRDELETLLDLSASQPSLPAGHPFSFGATLSFWTQTKETLANQTITFYVNFFLGQTNAAGSLQPNAKNGVWCVRGPATGSR